MVAMRFMVYSNQLFSSGCALPSTLLLTINSWVLGYTYYLILGCVKTNTCMGVTNMKYVINHILISV